MTPETTEPMSPETRAAHQIVFDAVEKILALRASQVPNDAKNRTPSTPNRLLYEVASPMDKTKPRPAKVYATQDEVYHAAEDFLRKAALADRDDDGATAVARQRLRDGLTAYRKAVDTDH